MKKLLFFAVLVIIASCSNSKKANHYSSKFNGTWTPVKQEMGGKELPVAFFAKQELIIADSNYTVIAESVDRGTVKYNGDKMDIYGKEGVNAGKHFTAIYKYENKQLSICYNLKGDSYPTTFDTKNQPLFFMSVFEKKK